MIIYNTTIDNKVYLKYSNIYLFLKFMSIKEGENNTLMSQALELKNLIIESGNRFNENKVMEAKMADYDFKVHGLALMLLEEDELGAKILHKNKQDYATSQRNRIKWVFEVHGEKQ